VIDILPSTLSDNLPHSTPRSRPVANSLQVLTAFKAVADDVVHLKLAEHFTKQGLESADHFVRELQRRPVLSIEMTDCLSEIFTREHEDSAELEHCHIYSKICAIHGDVMT